MRVGNRERTGFTMIELLVVIAIIGVLVGIMLPAIQVVREKAKVAKAQADIGQLTTAISTAKDTMNAKFVPSSSGPGNTDYIQFFGPRFLQSGYIPNSMGGNQCLVFYLGGMTVSGTGPSTAWRLGRGFSDSSQTPFTASTTVPPRVRGPFFDFPEAQLSGGPGMLNPTGPTCTVPTFLDPWGNPYSYRTTRNGNGDYDTSTGTPQSDSNGKYFNYNSFQIISNGSPKLAGLIKNW